MTDTISCPQCGLPIESLARNCEHCGVDLAIAAVIAEHMMGTPSEIGLGVPLTPEMLVPKLGSYLMEKGVLDSTGLENALEYQRDQAAQGNSVLLGQALRELGLVDAETIDQAVTMQILNLQKALQDSNRHLEARVKERTLELERAIEKLTELNKLKANFIANVSHELRTPLAHIRGYLDLLIEGSIGSLTPEQLRAIEVIERAETRLESLIEDLIQFSLAARGELKLSTAPTEIGWVIYTIVDQARAKAEKKGVFLDVYLADNIPLVNCDGEKIGWVISQILDNAIKFTPKAGRVTIDAIVDDNLVTIKVTDTGIGIPSSRIHEIFEPFHQLDGTSTRRYGGAGLGLSLSNRILAAHDIQMSISSSEGEGSVFRFSLPVVDVIMQKENLDV